MKTPTFDQLMDPKLMHARTLDAEASVSRGGGGNKFIESKVKRDGLGKFAKKESRNFKDLAELFAWRDAQIKAKFGPEALEDGWLFDQYEKTWKTEDLSFEEFDKIDKEYMSIQEEAMKIAQTTPHLKAEYTTAYKEDLEKYRREMKQGIFDTLDDFLAHYEIPFEELVGKTEEEFEATLAHYGVRGMKWGIRRTDAQLARARKTSDLPASEDAIKAVTSKAKVQEAGSLNVLSSKELQQLVDRINLEQRYVTMTTQTATIKKGESLVKKILKNEIESAALKGKPGPIASGIDALLNQKLGKNAKK